MFGLMRVATHERLVSEIIDEYRKRHEDIIDDLATNIWLAADANTKEYIARTPGVTIRSLVKKRYGYSARRID